MSRKHCISDSRISQRGITIKPTVNQKRQVPIEVGQPGVVAKFDQFVVDVGVSQYLQLLDVLNHFPGFVGNEGMHKDFG